jgi:hypothetical protein
VPWGIAPIFVFQNFWAHYPLSSRRKTRARRKGYRQLIIGRREKAKEPRIAGDIVKYALFARDFKRPFLFSPFPKKAGF